MLEPGLVVRRFGEQLPAVTDLLGRGSGARVARQLRLGGAVRGWRVKQARQRLALDVDVGQHPVPPDRSAQMDAVLATLVDLAVDHGRAATVLQHDPAVLALIGEHAPLRALTERLAHLLLGPDPTARIASSVVGQGLMRARTDPALADLQDHVLRRELLTFARSALGTP